MLLPRIFYFTIGIILAAIGLGAADLQQLLAAHRVTPRDWRICHQIGVQYVETEQLEQALIYFTKTVALNPQFIPARKNRATVLWFLGRKTEAEQEFLKLVQQAPADSTVHFYLGMANYSRKHYTAARNHFVKAGDLAFGNPEAIPAIVETFLKVNDVSILRSAIETLRASPGIANRQIIDTAEVLIANGRDTEALMLLEGKPEDADGASLLAQAYDHLGRNEQAYSAYLRAIELLPSDENYLALSAFAAAHQNTAFALDTIRKGLAQSPNSPSLLLNEGILLALSGSKDLAKDRMQRASEFKRNWADPILCIGVLNLESGNIIDAVQSLRHATELANKDYRTFYLLAVALNRLGDSSNTSELLNVLSKAVSLNGQDSRPYVLLGQTYLQQGNLNSARSTLEKALRLDATNLTAAYQLGLLHRKLGNLELSAKYMDQFRNLKSREVEHQSELIQILKVRRD